MKRRFRGYRWRRVLALLALSALWCVPAWPASARPGELNFPPTNYTIRSIDGAHTIGHAHFGVTDGTDGLTTVRGEYRFLDGDYDIDESTVRYGTDGKLPRLVREQHSFFFAGGAPDRSSRIDIAAGTGECTVYKHGKPEVSRETFDFPDDIFAGDVVILPLRRFVRDGARGSISFHVFNCIPGPKVLKVNAHAAEPAPWKYYPGDLVEVEVTPDFGWINYLIAPFLPRIRAWFDPSDDWFFVGGESARYYMGLKYMMVRHHPLQAELKAVAKPSPGAQPTPGTKPTPMR